MAGATKTVRHCWVASTNFWGILRRSNAISLGKKFIMSLKAVEEVSAEVPADDFQALEGKVYRTIEMYKAAREARLAAERDVQRLRQQLKEREEEIETLRREAVQFRKDREEVKRRVEKMMRQIDTVGEEQVAS